LALAGIYDGGSRSDTTRIAAVSLQIVRDCLPRFNAKEPDTAATQRMLVRNRQKFGSNLKKTQRPYP
jgi:hypothetical protein